MSNLLEASELNSIKEEMADRFGPPPEEVTNLFMVMDVRLIMKA